MLLGTSQAPDTPPHQASPRSLPTADTTENLTLAGREGRRGGTEQTGRPLCLSSLAFLRNLLPKMPSVALPSVRSTEMEEPMLSPLLGTMKGGSLTTPKATPLKPLSLVHQGKRGWRAMLATQSRDKTSKVMSQAQEALPLASER